MSANMTPPDWTIGSLDTLVASNAPIGYGIVQPGPSVSDGVPMIAIRDLLNIVPARLHRTSRAIEANYVRSRVEPGDVLISVKGTTGRVGLVPDGLYGNISRDVARVRFRANQVPRYWLQLLRSEGAQRVLEQAGVGSTRQELSIGILRRLEFPHPMPEEQEVIAGHLGDADDLVNALEALIAKKRDIKQGMMQELLTGRTRLPGFTLPWQEVAIGDVGFVSGSGVDKKTVPGEPMVKLLNYMDVYRAEFITHRTADQKVSAPTSKVSLCSVKAGDVFFTPTSETPDDIARSAVAEEDSPESVYSYHLVRWRPSGEWDVNYLGYAFNTTEFRAQATTLASGSGTRYVISLPGFRGLRIRQPDLDEQHAIGLALRSTSNELEALERRLESALAIKQGVMQELLTGRTRLPVEEVAI